MGLKPCVYDELILQHNKDKIVLTTVVKGEVVIKEMHQLNMDETKDLNFLLGELKLGESRTKRQELLFDYDQRRQQRMALKNIL